MRRRTRLAAVVVLIGLVATACGGDTDGATTVGGSQISTTARDFEFTPDAWIADAGTQVSISLENQGSETHEWVILNTRIESESEFTEDLVIFRASNDAGDVDTFTFTAPAAGTYQIICSIPGHFAAGMEGQFTVSG